MALVQPDDPSGCAAFLPPARVCAPLFTGLTTGSGMTEEETELFIDPANPASPFNPTTIDAWTRACHQGIPADRDFIVQTLGVGQDVMNGLCNWLVTIDFSYVSDATIDYFATTLNDPDIKTLNDLAYAQWGYGKVYPTFELSCFVV